MLVLVSLYGGFVAANQSRFPGWKYAWMVSEPAVVGGPTALWLPLAAVL